MKPLLVQVDDIRESAQPWEAALSREALDEMLRGDPPTEFHAAGSATARAKLTRMGKKVLVQAKFDVPLKGSCKRCLKDVELSEEIELTLTYQPAPSREKESRKKIEVDEPSQKLNERQSMRPDRDEEGSGGSFDFALADEETYSGQTIDLAPAIREQVILAAPASPVCSEDCKGLCATCGQDKNLVDCGCVEVRIDPRWEALKGLQVQVKSQQESLSNLKPSNKE